MNKKGIPALSPDVFAAVGKEHPQALSSLRQLEEGVQKFWKTYSVSLAVADDETFATESGTLEEAFQLRITFLQVSLARRLTALLVSLIDHINAMRLLDAALSTRACIELAGAIVYYEKRITALLTAGICTQEQMDRFNDIVEKAIRGGRFDWIRWVRGGADLQRLIREYADENANPTVRVRVKNVWDFVKCLDEAVATEEPPLGTIRTVYALLSDICHPAVGGYMLYLSVPQPPGYLKFEAYPNVTMACWFVGSIISPTANRLMRHAARSLNRLTYVASTVRALGSTQDTQDTGRSNISLQRTARSARFARLGRRG